MRTLLKVKKQFVDTYGEVPPMIGFLGLDTDGGAYREEVDSRYGKIKLDPNEQIPLEISNARAIYNNHRDRMTWIQDRNAAALDGLKNIGAGQIRSNGRFVLKYRYKEVYRKIKAVVDQISAADIMQGVRYNVLKTEAIDIHMVFSVCGGTGCGTFIDMAYLIKEAVPNCKLSGYAVLPDVFESMSTSGMAKVKPNAYGAIQDLDYLMHLDVTREPVEFDWLTTTSQSNERPFNAFFFVDNKNTSSDVYDNVLYLEDMMALALVTSAGELSVAAASVSDNIEKNIMEGDMDIGGKKAWVSSMGVCEILFRARELRRIYSLKAAKLIIERMRTSCADIDTMVNSWIDSPEINIRENNGKDNVIDYLLRKDPEFPCTINEGTNPRPEVEGYLKSAVGKDDDIRKRREGLMERVSDGLDRKLKSIINQECGVENAKNFLGALKKQVDIFLGEMNTESKEWAEDKHPKSKAALDASISDLKDYSGRFLRQKRKTEEYCEEVIANVTRMAVCEREIKRRNEAIAFFTGLEQIIAEASLTIHHTEKALDTVYQNCTQKIAEIQNNVDNAIQTFQIDLTGDKMQNVDVAVADVNFGDFIKYLETERMDVLSFERMKTADLEKVILRHTDSLPGAERWGRQTVEDALGEMSPDEFNQLMQNAITKSLPLLKFDDRGYIPREQPGDFYYIGVNDKACTRLAQDDSFKKLVPGVANVFFSSIGQKERIIIYHQVGVVPAFEIAPLFSYKEKYENCNTFCHFDVNVHRRMEREEYSLLPPDAKDDSLELWVKGILVGNIKNEGGRYYVYSESLGDPLDDYWYGLGEYRDEAFAKFKSNRSTLGAETERAVDGYETTHGSQEVSELMKDVKAAGRYLEVYSQVGMSREDLKKKGYEGVRRQMQEEIEFVTKSL